MICGIIFDKTIRIHACRAHIPIYEPLRVCARTGQVNDLNVRTKRLEEITYYFNLLSNPTRFGILVALYGGEAFFWKTNSLTLSELKRVLGVSKTNLSYHLKMLVDSDLVEKLEMQDDEDKKTAFYRTSEAGKKLLEKLDAMEIMQSHFKSAGLDEKLKVA